MATKECHKTLYSQSTKTNFSVFNLCVYVYVFTYVYAVYCKECMPNTILHLKKSQLISMIDCRFTFFFLQIHRNLNKVV